MARKKNSLINRLNDFKKLPKIKMPKLKLDNIDRIEELRVDFEKYVQNAPRVDRGMTFILRLIMSPSRRSSSSDLRSSEIMYSSLIKTNLGTNSSRNTPTVPLPRMWKLWEPR